MMCPCTSPAPWQYELSQWQAICWHPLTESCCIPRAGQWVIQEAKLAYGGVAPKTIMAPKAAAALTHQALSHGTLKAAIAAVAEDVQISANAPGISS